ncbi:MAG: acyl-CoA thioesterase [Nitrospirae bacterium]|nr:acyl-CoA thioesterase [Nitrospirota bacterium]
MEKRYPRIQVEEDPAKYNFKTSLRVRFAETDAQGVVYNSNYLVYFEVARVEYFRNLFGENWFDGQRPYNVTVGEAGCRFKSPARFDQVLDLHVRIGEMRNASYVFEYLIRNARTGEAVAVGYTTLVTLSKDSGRAIRVSEEVRQKIMTFEKGHVRTVE